MLEVNQWKIRNRFSVEDHDPGGRDAAFREQSCPACGEPYGHRKLAEVHDDSTKGYEVVHKTCASDYKDFLASREIDKAQAEVDAEKRRLEAEREERRHRRGILEDYLQEPPKWGGDDEDRFWYVVRSAARKIELADEELKAWTSKVLEARDPSHEMEWSRGAFDAAAQKHVAQRYVIAAFEAGATLEGLVKFVKHELLTKASSVNNQSTSPTDNYMKLEIVAKLADLMKSLDGDSFGSWGW